MPSWIFLGGCGAKRQMLFVHRCCFARLTVGDGALRDQCVEVGLCHAGRRVRRTWGSFLLSDHLLCCYSCLSQLAVAC